MNDNTMAVISDLKSEGLLLKKGRAVGMTFT
jgi:hypothetical protein